MTTTSFFRYSVPALLSALGLAGCRDSTPDRPNILYIMADDHAAAAIGAYGSHLARINPTPNLDRFASEGMLFTNCFATNSICTPSRACILTGQYSQTNGVLDLEDRQLTGLHPGIRANPSS